MTIWMKLETWMGMATSATVIVLSIVAFIRHKNAGWLLLSGSFLFSLSAGVITMYILAGRPGMVFALTDIVASGMLIAAVCLLALSKSK